MTSDDMTSDIMTSDVFRLEQLIFWPIGVMASKIIEQL